MTSREEAERLLSSLDDGDLVEIDSEGNIYAVGNAPAVPAGKSIAGISDQKGEYRGNAGYRGGVPWTSG